MEGITVKPENLVKAITMADVNTAEILATLFGIDKDGVRALAVEHVEKQKPITERIKSYEDACEVLGLEPHVLFDDSMPYDVVAYIKLRTIVEALNEGWLPQFTEDECRYYPWFYLYTQEEIDNMNEDHKKDLVIFGGGVNYGSSAGLACSHSCHAPSDASSALGSRLCLKTSELALYCGKRFADIWADFCFIRK